MFLGKFEHRLDPKGRLAVPARFREQLPSGSVVTIAPDSCLRLYPPGEWEKVSEQYQLNAATDSTERNLIRRMFAEASHLEFDAQGRSLIPAHLRQAAGLESDVIVNGANNVVEVWSQQRWRALESDTADFTRLADEVARNRTANS